MLTHIFGYGFSAAISRLMLLSFVAFLPFIGGCGEDDNPIIDDDHDHDHDAPLHADVDGFFLEVDGKEVYRQFQGTDSGDSPLVSVKRLRSMPYFLMQTVPKPTSMK